MTTKIIKCPYCNSGKQQHKIKTKDYLLTQEPFAIYQCTTCKLQHTQPRPTPEALPRYYESDQYISHTDQADGLIQRIYKIVRRYTLASKRRLVEKQLHSESPNVLDIGCGTGHFLQALPDHMKKTGIEPNPTARALTEQSLPSVTLHESIDQLDENQQYDLITLWHVLEHVYDLPHTIKTLKRILAPHGTLIIAVPNYRSADAAHYQDKWAAYDVPRHLYHFSEEAIQTMFKDHKLTLVKKKPMIFDSIYVSMLSEKYKESTLQLPKAIMYGLWSNMRAIFSKQHSSQIYIFQHEK